MKKSLIALAVLFLLFGVLVQSSLAYSYVEGCVVDGSTGQGWTHGGTVTIDGGIFGTQTTTLDANGCFGPTAMPTSQFGNPEMTVTIDMNPGPGGDPDDIICTVPQDHTSGPDAIYNCGVMATDTGPNAIVLLSMTPGANTGMTLAAFALVIAGFSAILGLAVLLRRRQQA
ncbi:MAG: hypothetical protein DSY55_01705 [Clostridia bacterium]|nr:MAG: hypothetical protein DSY55_01705 [Clostridia bacterium]